MKITTKPRARDMRKKRVAAYCRVSTLLDVQEDSLETQTAYYKSYIEAHPDWEFAGIYADQKTGTDSEKRVGFQQMVDKACSGGIDTILTKSISRFSRNLVNTMHYVEVLDSHGVNVIFEKEGIDSAKPSSTMIFSFLAAIAQNESQSISANIRTAVKKKAQRGEYSAGSHQCFGYEAVDGKLVPDDDAPIVEVIYRMYLEGKTCAEISKMMAELGVVGRRGEKITAAGINYILRNETYVGDKRLLKTGRKELFTGADSDNETIYLENDHEAVVDRETWNAVQKRLNAKGMTGRQNVQRGGGKTHFLHDKLICGCCGSLMTRRTLRAYCKAGEEPVRYKAWECYEHHKGKAGNGCKQKALKEDLIVRAIEDAIDMEVTEDSVAAIERVVITGEEIVVERKAV